MNRLSALFNKKSAEAKESSTHTNENVVKIVGTVTDVDGSGRSSAAVVRTVIPNWNGSMKFEEDHVVMGIPKSALGKHIGVIGHLSNMGEGEDRQTIVIAHEFKESSEKDANIAKVIGTAISGYRHHPAIDGKRAFGSVTIKTETGKDVNYVNVAAFSSLSAKLAGRCTANSTVQVIGQLRYREYNGRAITEIIASEENTKVLAMGESATPDFTLAGEQSSI